MCVGPNGHANQSDAARRMQCEICEVIRNMAAPVSRRFKFSMLFVPGTITPMNVISSSVGGSGLLQSVQCSCEAKEMPMLSRDVHRDNGT